MPFRRWISLRVADRDHRPFEGREGDWKPLAALAAGCLGFGVVGLILEAGAPTWGAVAYLAAFICGGWDAAIEVWTRLRRRELDIHFLMLAVAAGAAVIGAWREGALLLFLFSAAGAMEQFSMNRTRREIAALLRGAPKTARVMRDGGGEEWMPIEALTPGLTVLVTAGEQVPVDLEVLRGETACDESNLTGESVPVDKQPGDTLLAGTMNLWGAIEGRVLRPAAESALQKIITLIRDAQESKAPSQRFTDRFGTTYTWSVLAACTVMFFVWWLVAGLPPFIGSEETPSALYRAMTLLVVASPCALVLSVPSAILAAIASGARRGILFRGGTAVEALSAVRVVALDKTGTLTSGAMTLEKVTVLRGDESRLRAVAAALAHLSQHPLSRAVQKTLHGVETPAVSGWEAIAGYGIRGRIDGREYRLGSSRFAGKGSTASHGAEVWISGEDVFGCLTFLDTVRSEAAEMVAALHRAGLRTVMLTGDQSGAAAAIARMVGVNEVRAGLSPSEKVAAIRELRRDGRVAMIGDGVNDAPSIAAADVGVAMGARGSDAALEQADVVLMNDRLENFLRARTLSVEASAVIRQNITVALGAVVVMMLVVLAIPAPLLLGVAVHEGSTVCVVLNSLRLLLFRRAA